MIDPTRRRVLKNALWGAALATIGVAPAGLWSFGFYLAVPDQDGHLSLRPIDWSSKPPSSAKTQETMPDGRVELRIEYDVLRRYSAHVGVVVALSRSTKIDRIGNNAAIFDFELSSEETATIGALTRSGSRIISPSGLARDWGM